MYHVIVCTYPTIGRVEAHNDQFGITDNGILVFGEGMNILYIGGSLLLLLLLDDALSSSRRRCRCELP